MPDLLSYFLSGEKTTEFTNASTTQMCDALNGLWAKDMLTKMDIPTEILTDIVMPGSIKGKLLPDISSELGIANIPILSAASHDTASAVASVPSTEDEFIYISSGTWSLMGAELKTPIVNDESYKFNFTNEKGANGTTRFQKNIMGLWIVQECIRQWKREGLDLDFKTIDMEIDNVEKFKSFIDPDDDLFISPGNMPKRIKDFCIKTGQEIPSNNIEIIQCIIQSLAMRYRETLGKIELLTGIKSDKIYLIGGGVKDINLCKSTASSTGKIVMAGPIEATAIGNIIVQLMGLGEIASLKEARQIISNSFSVNTYTPSKKEKWDDGYVKFKNVCNGM
jgi:rhamnulokinase/L-fuculokinase